MRVAPHDLADQPLGSTVAAEIRPFSDQLPDLVAYSLICVLDPMGESFRPKVIICANMNVVFS